MQKGIFARYKNNIYSVSNIKNGKIKLVSQSGNDIKLGFEEKIYPNYYKNHKELPRVFIKEVNSNEIEELFEIDYKAEYKGHQVNISSNEKDGMVYLGTTDARIATKLDFDRTDKYYYEKWVPKEEVEIFEEKKFIDL